MSNQTQIITIAGAVLAGMVNSGQVQIRNTPQNPITPQDVDRSVKEGIDAALGLAHALVKRGEERFGGIVAVVDSALPSRNPDQAQAAQSTDDETVHRPAVKRKVAPTPRRA